MSAPVRRPRPLAGFGPTARWLPALSLLALTASCTEDPLSLGKATAPGASTDTRDVTLSVADLPSWRDTTLTGFALPSNASFVFLANDPAVSGRTLMRFDIPDTIRTFVDTLPVDNFDSVNVLLRVDTLRSDFSGLPVVFRLLQVDRPFDADSVTWREASPGVPWQSPGGDLGVEIASGTLDAMADTVFMQVAVSEDSLLKAWQEKDGDHGVALVVEGPPARVRLGQVVLRYAPTLVGRELPVPQSQLPEPRTFILDPPLPPAGEALRIGGIPASRVYLEFTPPETVDGIPLRGATVNHAELVLHPLPAPPDPFAAEAPIEARQVTLLGDPFALGVKTPIGTGNATLLSLGPDLLGAGTPLRLDITLLLSRAAQDSVAKIRIGLRGDPDAQTIGFWELGSLESAAALRPQLRLVLSPPPRFGVP